MTRRAVAASLMWTSADDSCGRDLMASLLSWCGKSEGLCGNVGARGRISGDKGSLVRSHGVMELRVGLRSVRSIFGGSRDQETVFFDFGVSGIKIGVTAGEIDKEKYFSGEGAAEDFSGELGAVSNISSPVALASPTWEIRGSEVIF